MTWIAIALMYVLSMGLLRWLGGISAAGEAFSRWGRAVAERHHGTVSSSS